jgi:DNA-directed RNA polymerase specialized sigma24 family protein
MLSPDENRIGVYEGMIVAAANRFRRAAEFDDLYQEGMIAVWNCPPDADPSYVSQAIYNRLKNWTRFVKRLRHHNAVDYGEIVDGVSDEHSGEHA